MRLEYRCVATSVAGFVQQLAVAYITHGYWFYVAGHIPERKNPACVDAKLIDRYGVAISKWARYRRKQQGLANVHYLRFDRTFILIATKGQHSFFENEAGNIRDVRRQPIRFAEYSIGFRMGVDRRGHPSVRLSADEYLRLKCYMLHVSTRWSTTQLGQWLHAHPYLAYAPVRRQLLNVVRAVNRERKIAGLDLIVNDVLNLRRPIVAPFGLGSSEQQAIN